MLVIFRTAEQNIQYTQTFVPIQQYQIDCYKKYFFNISAFAAKGRRGKGDCFFNRYALFFKSIEKNKRLFLLVEPIFGFEKTTLPPSI